MIPFDEHWIHHIERQYGLKSKLEQPYIYHIATNPDAAATRHLANRFVDRLPAKVQAGFIRRLRTGSSFSDAFHEVVVGEMLARCGPLPEYEAELAAKKTPDWHIRRCDGQNACAVEVVSRNTQVDSPSELVLRLRQIPRGVVLNMECASEHVALSSGEAKRIASSVWKWLGSASTVTDSKLQIHEFCFTVLAIQSGDDHVAVIQDFDAIWVDLRPLRSVVVEKVHKYTAVCRDSGTALVIAVVADVGAGASTRSAESILLGSLKGTLVFDKSTGQVLSTRWYRAHDGIFERYPYLGATAWITCHGLDTWTSTLFVNPLCDTPIPSQVLKGLQSTMIVVGVA
jgi:hypothetical protein